MISGWTHSQGPSCDLRLDPFARTEITTTQEVIEMSNATARDHDATNTAILPELDSNTLSVLDGYEPSVHTYCRS